MSGPRPKAANKRKSRVAEKPGFREGARSNFVTAPVLACWLDYSDKTALPGAVHLWPERPGPKSRNIPGPRDNLLISWRERRDSNPRPPA
jgi:hypothetical protein